MCHSGWAWALVYWGFRFAIEKDGVRAVLVLEIEGKNGWEFYGRSTLDMQSLVFLDHPVGSFGPSTFSFLTMQHHAFVCFPAERRVVDRRYRASRMKEFVNAGIRLSSTALSGPKPRQVEKGRIRIGPSCYEGVYAGLPPAPARSGVRAHQELEDLDVVVPRGEPFAGRNHYAG